MIGLYVSDRLDNRLQSDTSVAKSCEIVCDAKTILEQCKKAMHRPKSRKKCNLVSTKGPVGTSLGVYKHRLIKKLPSHEINLKGIFSTFHVNHIKCTLASSLGTSPWKLKFARE